MIIVRPHNKYSIPKKSERGVVRKPLRLFAELAEDYGVLLGQLTWAVQHALIPFPEPEIVTGRKRWYNQDKARAWWNAIGGASFCVSDKPDRGEYMREYQREYRRKKTQSSLTECAQ